jgi:excisionase family DNA binding protein
MGKMLPMTGTKLLTSGEVAAQCGVNRVTVHHWAKDGKLRVAQVVNGMRLFDATDVDKFAAARATETSA